MRPSPRNENTVSLFLFALYAHSFGHLQITPVCVYLLYWMSRSESLLFPQMWNRTGSIHKWLCQFSFKGYFVFHALPGMVLAWVFQLFSRCKTVSAVVSLYVYGFFRNTSVRINVLLEHVSDHPHSIIILV
jgi:hypothetical protein